MRHTHIDLFSGIGGFALAARWCGLETEVFCEGDEDRASWLETEWPSVPVIRDVREFDGRRWQGRWLLSAGVPCQPASVAGKRLGAADDRWLWPETVRVIDEARPRWVLCENPPGVWGVGLDGVLAEMEGLGYDIRPIEIPACAVGAPHRRQRVWIIGYRVADGGETGLEERQGQRRDAGEEQPTAERDDTGRRVAEGEGQRGRTGLRTDEPGGRHGERLRDESSHGVWGACSWVPWFDPRTDTWKASRYQPGILGLADGIPAAVRRAAVSAFGDAIVPQVAVRIIEAMKEADA